MVYHLSIPGYLQRVVFSSFNRHSHPANIRSKEIDPVFGYWIRTRSNSDPWYHRYLGLGSMLPNKGYLGF